jgi:putative transposase
MLVRQAFRFELDPNNVQRTALAQHAGAARYAYNWGLADQKRRLDAGEALSNAFAQGREWNRYKREGAPWWSEVSKCAPQEALRDLDKAIKSFFRRRKRGGAGRVGFPKFKRKGRNDSFRLTGSIHVNDKSVTLPRIGKIRTKEPTTKISISRARIISATCRREADRWFVSLNVEIERVVPPRAVGPVVGIDMGIRNFAVCSDGVVIQRPMALRKDLRKVRQLSKSFSRKQTRSKNQEKAKLRLASQHRRIRNRRRDAHHKATTHLAKTKRVIVIESLNISGMRRNRHLSRAISDLGWGEFSRQLDYKCRWYGCELLTADSFFPSTKKCSGCGEVASEVPLSQQTFACGSCGMSIDRDLNAASNLERIYVAASSAETQNARGERSSGQAPKGFGETTFSEAGTEQQTP